MDLMTFIKKEEPVEFVLTTTDDNGKVEEPVLSKVITVTTESLPICLENMILIANSSNQKEEFTAIIKQELNSWSGSDNENTDRDKVTFRFRDD